MEENKNEEGLENLESKKQVPQTPESFEELEKSFEKEVDQNITEFKQADTKIEEIKQSVNLSEPQAAKEIENSLQINETLQKLNADVDQLKNETENKEVNLEATPEIKKGADFVFEKYPELAEIGNEKQYSEYLDTIFPGSKVKGIFYHGTNKKLDDFKFRSLGLPSAHFIDNKDFAELWAKDRTELRGEGSPEVYAAIVNILNDEKDIDDGLIKKYDNEGGVTGNEITMYRENDVHLLGSPKDIEGFRNFVNKKDINDNLSGTSNQDQKA